MISLGLVMLNRGLAMTGTGYDIHTLLQRGQGTGERIEAKQGRSSRASVQEIYMEVKAGGYEPNRFVLKKGVPVRWIIEGKELTGCNRVILVPRLDLEIELKPGNQVIEFTPEESGQVSWSCWMGMLHGEFIVVDAAMEAGFEPLPFRPWIRRGRIRSSAASLARCRECR